MSVTTVSSRLFKDDKHFSDASLAEVSKSIQYLEISFMTGSINVAFQDVRP